MKRRERRKEETYEPSPRFIHFKKGDLVQRHIRRGAEGLSRKVFNEMLGLGIVTKVVQESPLIVNVHWQKLNKVTPENPDFIEHAADVVVEKVVLPKVNK